MKGTTLDSRIVYLRGKSFQAFSISGTPLQRAFKAVGASSVCGFNFGINRRAIGGHIARRCCTCIRHVFDGWKSHPLWDPAPAFPSGH
jgi:hypothetical protein